MWCLYELCRLSGYRMSEIFILLGSAYLISSYFDPPRDEAPIPDVPKKTVTERILNGLDPYKDISIPDVC